MATSPDFESIKQINVYGIVFWSARDLMPLLGYGRKWQNFVHVIEKAITACEESGNRREDHFTDASKGIVGGKGSISKWKDYLLLISHSTPSPASARMLMISLAYP